MQKRFLVLISYLLVSSLLLSAYGQTDVKKFGAKGDGKTLDTAPIQKAIDRVNLSGGGTVNIPAGTYLVGTLVLKDNVNLHLQTGAELLGSPDYRNYTEIIHKFDSRTNGLYAKYFVIFAEGARNISITGFGTINGNGLKNYLKDDPQNLRPFTIRLVNCRNVIIRDVHILEAANWTLHLLGCTDVNVDGVVIENGVDGNRDGIDIDCCQRVTVSNSRFSTGDDAIVMKASNDILCQDITITNCLIRTRASAIKTGTESNGGFKNITVSNCIIKDIPRHAGIELMTVDGGVMENILIENITMENVATPIFIRLGIRVRPFKSGQYVSRVDDVKDITLNNISVLNAKLPSSIMGLHNKKIRNITISNYTVRNSEIQTPTPYNKVPFEEFSYPMAIMFQNLPAFGIYCRNVEDIHMQNITMYPADKETRPALGFDRVNDLDLLSVRGGNKNQTSPLVHLRNVNNVMAGFCRSFNTGNTLFEAEEGTCENILLSGNLLDNGQSELLKVPALADEHFFEDFKTEISYSVLNEKTEKGLPAHDLKSSPLKFSTDITKRGSLQLCLLILNESPQPAKVLVKYEGITQEFSISWSDWGWAPITLLKEYPVNEKVDFEILPADDKSDLKISKAYFRYQDLAKTD